ncbi:MAG: two-component system sensor histidine kinase NtrB [Candidatus Rokuibacteriota bacterium]
MSASLVFGFVSTLAFAIQFLIFVYLYPSHRVRFFTYFVWAWGLFTASKGLKLAETILPAGVDLTPAVNAATVLASLCVLAAGLAYRRDYRVRPRDLVIGAAVTGLAAVAAGTGDISEGGTVPRIAVGVLLGATQIAAGLAFWPAPPPVGARGARFLALCLGTWGLHRALRPFVHADPGTTMYMAVHGLFIFFYFLTTFAVIIMVLDRARSETRSLQEFNERLVDGLGDGLQLVDGDFRVRHANRGMQARFGPMTGRLCYEVITADGRPCPGCPLARRTDIGEAERLEVSAPHGRRLALSCAPVRQPDGEVFLLEVVADITEQERLRARLIEAQRLAAVGELAASVAHEIRNPLSAIVNATTLLAAEETLTAEERATTVGAVRTEARRLNRILSDFLLYARPSPPRLVPGDVGEVVQHVAALIGDDRGGARTVEVDVSVAPEAPPAAYDRDLMTQVLWNVALNGIEAMDRRGRLRFEVTREDGHVAMAVSDTGRGIPPDELRRVFEPFYSRKPGGSGLGLTIARRIVESHGGRIEVESEPGRGTRVTIALPAAVGS